MLKTKIFIGFLAAAVGASGACTRKSEPAKAESAKPTGACSYETNPNDVLLEWTGYKTTQKVGATGKFSIFTVEGATSAPSLPELMKGLSASLDASAVATGNPGRDATLQEFFFAKLNPPFKMKASIDRVEGDESKGTLFVKAEMNGQSHVLPMAYTGNPNAGTIEAVGSLDILQFGAQAAYDSIHGACQSLHTGTDGVAKTWTTVDLKLTGKYQKVCR
jgi:hypothetical protein